MTTKYRIVWLDEKTNTIRPGTDLLTREQAEDRLKRILIRFPATKAWIGVIDGVKVEEPTP